MLLREDRGFRRYEMGFMAYGLAWMMLQPTIPVFLVEKLQVAYTEVANARGLIYFAMIAALSHPFGRLLDRIGPIKVSRIAFTILAIFPLLLASARGVGMAYLAFLVYGCGMAAVNLGWTTGPIHFARERDSAGYMGAHVALVGVRAIVGGPFGIWLYRASGSPTATFALASALFLVGSLIMAPRRRRGLLAPADLRLPALAALAQAGDLAPDLLVDLARRFGVPARVGGPEALLRHDLLLGDLGLGLGLDFGDGQLLVVGQRDDVPLLLLHALHRQFERALDAAGLLRILHGVPLLCTYDRRGPPTRAPVHPCRHDVKGRYGQVIRLLENRERAGAD